MTVALPNVVSSEHGRTGAPGPLRGVLLALVVARAATSASAVALAPFLWREHFLALVILRPTKEVLLAAGFEVRAGDLAVLSIAPAVVPLMVLGVWLFFFLGRAYAEPVQEGELPGIAGRMLPTDRVQQLCRILERRGVWIIFLGRLAVFPSSLMATAAGVAGMPVRRFLVADGLGAAASVLLVVGVGYELGEAYERGGVWVTALGVVVAAGMLVALGRWLKAEDQDEAGA